MISAEQNLGELRAKYHLGSLYLTFIPINDLTQLFCDEDRRPRFKELTSEPNAVETFWTFLKQNRFDSINEAIAFLQLDLNTREAGYKKASDRDGDIRPVSWSKPEVQGIAELCDVYFHRLTQFENIHESISSGEAPLRQAWNDVTELKEDPFLTNARIASLLGNFKVLVDQKPVELEALKLDDRAAHDAITNVKSQYDAYLAKQQDEEPLARLWSAQKDIAKHIKGIKIATLNVNTLLVEERVMADLKDSAAVFEDLGLLSCLKSSNKEELLQINEYLRFIPIEKDRSTLDTLAPLELGSFGCKGFGGIP